MGFLSPNIHTCYSQHSSGSDHVNQAKGKEKIIPLHGDEFKGGTPGHTVQTLPTETSPGGEDRVFCLYLLAPQQDVSLPSPFILGIIPPSRGNQSG